MHSLAWRIGPTALCAAVLLGCGVDVQEAAPDTGGESSTGGTSSPPSTSETTPTSGSESTTMSSDSATSQGPASNTDSQSGTETTTGPITATATTTTTTDGSTTMSVDPTETTGSTTMMSSTTGSSSGGDSSSTGMMECREPDRDEPNDEEGQSDPSGDVECADPQQQSIEGALHDATDVDWFQFNEIWDEDDCGGQGFDPRITVDIDVGVVVCVYFDCNTGTNNLLSCNGATQTASPDEGWLGCCQVGGAVIDFECSGTADESAQTRIAVSDGPNACTPYTLTYDVSIIN